MKGVRIASVVCFAALTGWVALSSSKGAGLETRLSPWVETDKRTRAERDAETLERRKIREEKRHEQRRNRDRIRPSPYSIRNYSGRSSRTFGRVK